jgi:small conductance mechanosensitive channel
MIENFTHWLQGFLSDSLSKAITALLLAIIGILVIRIVMTVLKKFLETGKLEKAAHTLIKSVVRVVLYLLLGLMVAESLGIDVTSVIALASVLTLAVSLALQNALANVIGGFTLLYTKPFVTGDFVEIAGQSGTVQTVGLTYTQLTTGDNKMVSIPNSAVVAAEIVNYTTTGTRRVDIAVSAGYDCAVNAVLEALKEA